MTTVLRALARWRAALAVDDYEYAAAEDREHVAALQWQGWESCPGNLGQLVAGWTAEGSVYVLRRRYWHQP